MGANAPAETGRPVGAIEMFEHADLEGLVDRIWTAARSVANGDEDAGDQLVDASAEVQSLETWATRAPRLRPTIALTEGLIRTITGFRAYLDAVTDALRVETIPEVQATESKVQAAIDSITSYVSDIGDAARRLTAILDAEDPAGAALRIGIETDYSTMEERGRAVLLAQLGLEADATASMYGLVGDALARTVGDSAAFWEVARSHLVVLQGGGSATTDALRLPEFARRQAEVAHDTLSAARRAAKTPHALTDREQLTDLLEAGHLVVEQPLKLHLGLACAATTKMDFARTQTADVSELGNVASDKGWTVAQHLPPPEVRNAFAHRRYAVEGEDVVFSGPKTNPTQTRMSSLELQDTILQTVEVAMAMDLAVAIVAADAGIEFSADLPAVWMAEALMVGLGWSGVSTCVVDGRVVAEATLVEDASLAVLSFAAHPLSRIADQLDLTLHGPTKSVRFLVPLGMFVSWTTIEDPVERSARYLVLSRKILRDGLPLITEDAARKVLAWTACEVAVDKGLEMAVSVGGLRIIRSAARNLGFDDLTRMLGRLVQWRLSLGTDTQVAYEEISDIFEAVAVTVDAPTEMLLS
ncbi:MAG: hypothetical protein JWM47_1240 [Acidimicrobiales bacterium]|nr:hypothetical protein [Acidimicrobiales bacterium]